MKPDDKIYYCNRPCVFLIDLEDEAFIELLTHEFIGDSDEYGGYTEPIYNRLIVNKKYLSTEKINLEEEFDKARKKIKEMEKEKINEIFALKNKTQLEIDELRKGLTQGALSHDGLQQFIDILDGKTKYIVKDHYSYGNAVDISILKPEECTARNYDDNGLCSIIFRAGDKKGTVEMFLGNYTDDSGTRYRSYAFRTLEEAKTHVAKKLDKANVSNISSRTIEACKEYKIDHPLLTKCKEAENKRTLEDVKAEFTRLHYKIESSTERMEEITAKYGIDHE